MCLRVSKDPTYPQSNSKDWAVSNQSFCSYVPLSCEKNYVSSFSQSPLMGSLSNLQVTRTGIKAQMSSNLGRIGIFTLELFALECEYFYQNLLWIHSSSNLQVTRTGMNEMLDGIEFQPDLTSHFGVTCLCVVKEIMSLAFLSHLW